MSYLDEDGDGRKVYYEHGVSVEVFEWGGDINVKTYDDGSAVVGMSPKRLRELAAMFNEAADGMEQLQEQESTEEA